MSTLKKEDIIKSYSYNRDSLYITCFGLQSSQTSSSLPNSSCSGSAGTDTINSLTFPNQPSNNWISVPSAGDLQYDDKNWGQPDDADSIPPLLCDLIDDDEVYIDETYNENGEIPPSFFDCNEGARRTSIRLGDLYVGRKDDVLPTGVARLFSEAFVKASEYPETTVRKQYDQNNEKESLVTLKVALIRLFERALHLSDETDGENSRNSVPSTTGISSDYINKRRAYWHVFGAKYLKPLANIRMERRKVVIDGFISFQEERRRNERREEEENRKTVAAAALKAKRAAEREWKKRKEAMTFLNVNNDTRTITAKRKEGLSGNKTSNESSKQIIKITTNQLCESPIDTPGGVSWNEECLLTAEGAGEVTEKRAELVQAKKRQLLVERHLLQKVLFSMPTYCDYLVNAVCTYAANSVCPLQPLSWRFAPNDIDYLTSKETIPLLMSILSTINNSNPINVVASNMINVVFPHLDRRPLYQRYPAPGTPILTGNCDQFYTSFCEIGFPEPPKVAFPNNSSKHHSYKIQSVLRRAETDIYGGNMLLVKESSIMCNTAKIGEVVEKMKNRLPPLWEAPASFNARRSNVVRWLHTWKRKTIEPTASGSQTTKCSGQKRGRENRNVSSSSLSKSFFDVDTLEDESCSDVSSSSNSFTNDNTSSSDEGVRVNDDNMCNIKGTLESDDESIGMLLSEKRANGRVSERLLMKEMAERKKSEKAEKQRTVIKGYFDEGNSVAPQDQRVEGAISNISILNGVTGAGTTQAVYAAALQLSLSSAYQHLTTTRGNLKQCRVDQPMRFRVAEQINAGQMRRNGKTIEKAFTDLTKSRKISDTLTSNSDNGLYESCPWKLVDFDFLEAFLSNDTSSLVVGRTLKQQHFGKLAERQLRLVAEEEIKRKLEEQKKKDSIQATSPFTSNNGHKNRGGIISGKDIKSVLNGSIVDTISDDECYSSDVQECRKVTTRNGKKNPPSASKTKKCAGTKKAVSTTITSLFAQKAANNKISPLSEVEGVCGKQQDEDNSTLITPLAGNQVNIHDGDVKLLQSPILEKGESAKLVCTISTDDVPIPPLCENEYIDCLLSVSDSEEEGYKIDFDDDKIMKNTPPLDIIRSMGMDALTATRNALCPQRNTVRSASDPATPQPQDVTIVLIEAGDVTFEDESGFSSSVKKMAKESKFPVLVTTNCAINEKDSRDNYRPKSLLKNLPNLPVGFASALFSAFGTNYSAYSGCNSPAEDNIGGTSPVMPLTARFHDVKNVKESQRIETFFGNKKNCDNLQQQQLLIKPASSLAVSNKFTSGLQPITTFGSGNFSKDKLASFNLQLLQQDPKDYLTHPDNNHFPPVTLIKSISNLFGAPAANMDPPSFLPLVMQLSIIAGVETGNIHCIVKKAEKDECPLTPITIDEDQFIENMTSVFQSIEIQTQVVGNLCRDYRSLCNQLEWDLVGCSYFPSKVEPPSSKISRSSSNKLYWSRAAQYKRVKKVALKQRKLIQERFPFVSVQNLRNESDTIDILGAKMSRFYDVSLRSLGDVVETVLQNADIQQKVDRFGHYIYIIKELNDAISEDSRPNDISSAREEGLFHLGKMATLHRLAREMIEDYDCIMTKNIRDKEQYHILPEGLTEFAEELIRDVDKEEDEKSRLGQLNCPRKALFQCSTYQRALKGSTYTTKQGRIQLENNSAFDIIHFYRANKNAKL